MADRLRVLTADLDDPEHAAAIVELIDGYAREPGGQSRPLTEAARRALVPGLRAHPGAQVLLALQRGAPVGVAVCVLTYSTFAGRPALNVHDLAVAAPERARGVGTALLRAAEALARERGCCKLTLEVHATNEGAQRLYTRLGFGSLEQATFFLTKPLTGEPAVVGAPRVRAAPDRGGALLSWDELRRRAPEHAAAGERLLVGESGSEVAFLATRSRDGQPHLAPVCPILAGRDLFLSLKDGSPKHRDLARDGRFTLHASLGPRDEEFQVSGRASELEDADERRRVHAAIRFQFDADDPLFRLRLARGLWCAWENPGEPGARAIRRPWSA